MVFSVWRTGALNAANNQRKHLHSTEPSTDPGPSSSLWPEPERPEPRFKPQVKSSTALEATKTSSQVVEGATGTHERTNVGVAEMQGAPSSTFPSSCSTTGTPPSRPINITTRSAFEPHYPTWHSYPPIHPTKFEKYAPFGPIRDEPYDPTDAFLQQSHAFEQWLKNKNAELNQIRYGPGYQKLLYELNQYEHLARQGATPTIRTEARQQVLSIIKEITEERQKSSAEEQQHIKGIKKAWVSFVSMDNHEQAASGQRHRTTQPWPEHRQDLSKVEMLLGSDGSSQSVSNYIQRSSQQSSGEPSPSSNKEEPDSGKRRGGLTNIPEPFPKRPYKILVPDWFPVFETIGPLRLNGATIEDRFKSLNDIISGLEDMKRHREYQKKHPEEEGVTKGNPAWDKNWHTPGSGWPHEHQRQNGGLWKCRKGPSATAAENRCKLCKTKSVDTTGPAEKLELLMSKIEEAMASVAKKDKAEVLARSASTKRKSTSLEPFNYSQVAGSTGLLSRPPPGDVAITTATDMISLGGWQSRINYNPLRGLEDVPESETKSETDSQRTVRGRQQQETLNKVDEASESKTKSDTDSQKIVTPCQQQESNDEVKAIEDQEQNIISDSSKKTPASW